MYLPIAIHRNYHYKQNKNDADESWEVHFLVVFMSEVTDVY